jgi:hypothetical protein
MLNRPESNEENFMTDAPIIFSIITVKAEGGNWADIYVPINSPKAVDVLFDARDSVKVKNTTAWKSTKDLRDQLAPELFEGFEGWTRRYTEDGTTLIVEYYFSNIALARAYNTAIVDIKQKMLELNPKSNLRDINFQFFYSYRNRKTGELYPFYENK